QICGKMREKGYASRIVVQRSTVEESLQIIKFWRDSDAQLEVKNASTTRSMSTKCASVTHCAYDLCRPGLICNSLLKVLTRSAGNTTNGHFTSLGSTRTSPSDTSPPPPPPPSPPLLQLQIQLKDMSIQHLRPILPSSPSSSIQTRYVPIHHHALRFTNPSNPAPHLHHRRRRRLTGVVLVETEETEVIIAGEKIGEPVKEEVVEEEEEVEPYSSGGS
ncbi:hypothetical protein AKJ16_DCAP12753, partial [Drosera capensis]